MSATIQSVEYFHATVRDEPGQAYALLSRLSGAGIDLLAFSVVPVGAHYTQLVLFPRDAHMLREVGRQAGLQLTGPDRAFLIQGDDELGALVDFHRRLSEADVNVYASSGVTDGRGGFGYVLYVRSEDHDAAVEALAL